MKTQNETEKIIKDNKELTDSEKCKVSLKDISKAIKKQLNKEYSSSKFSIQTQYYAGGQSLHINIMESDFKIILPFEEISEKAIWRYESRSYTKEQLKSFQNTKHHQLSSYIENTYNPDDWNNGVFLTLEGYKLVKRIIDLSNKFNWDNSDAMIDYFDVKFYLHLSIGKWDKEYKESCSVVQNIDPGKKEALIKKGLPNEILNIQEFKKYKFIDNDGNQYIYNAKNENDARNSFRVEKGNKIKTILDIEVLQ